MVNKLKKRIKNYKYGWDTPDEDYLSDVKMSEISFSSDIESIGWEYSYLYHNSNLSNECEADFLDTRQESYYEDAEYHFDDQVLMIIKKAVLFQKNRFKMLTENQLHLMLYR